MGHGAKGGPSTVLSCRCQRIRTTGAVGELTGHRYGLWMEPRSTSDELQPIAGAVDLVRRRPHMFFQDGAPLMSALLAGVVSDASDAGCCAIEVRRCGPWGMVCGDVDWMEPGAFEFTDLFDRFVSHPGRLKTDFRAEILVVAVADGVLTAGKAGEFASGLTLDDLPPRMARMMLMSARSIVWRLPSEHLAAASSGP